MVFQSETTSAREIAVLSNTVANTPRVMICRVIEKLLNLAIVPSQKSRWIRLSGVPNDAFDLWRMLRTWSREVSGEIWGLSGINVGQYLGTSAESSLKRELAMLRFGLYQLDPAQGLRRGTRDIRITPKSLSLLHFLAERAGQVVTKEDVFHTVWPDATVSDSALTSCIQELRPVLRDDARQPRFIETLHRRGYRFIPHTSGEVRKIRNEVASAATVPFLRDDVPFVGREALMQEMLKA